MDATLDSRCLHIQHRSRLKDVFIKLSAYMFRDELYNSGFLKKYLNVINGRTTLRAL
jgi:hypothetical protein